MSRLPQTTDLELKIPIWKIRMIRSLGNRICQRCWSPLRSHKLSDRTMMARFLRQHHCLHSYVASTTQLSNKDRVEIMKWKMNCFHKFRISWHFPISSCTFYQHSVYCHFWSISVKFLQILMKFWQKNCQIHRKKRNEMKYFLHSANKLDDFFWNFEI